MSETKFKAPRKIEHIQREYQFLCARAGEIQFKRSQLENDLKILNESIRELVLESAASENAAAEEAKAKKEAETNNTAESKQVVENKEIA